MKKLCININSYILNIMIVLLLSFGLSVIGFQISSVFDIEILKRLMASPMLLLLNTLPLTIAMLFAYFITSRLWTSYLIAGGFFIFIQYVNRYKIRLRHEPLVPADFVLGNESTKVVKISELQLNFGFFIVITSFLVISLILLLFIKSKKINWPVRAIGSVLSIVIFILLYRTYYNDVKLYNSFKTYGSEYSQVDIVQSRGFTYAFFVKTHVFNIVKPEGYSIKYAESILQKYKSKSDSGEYNEMDINTSELPHVIAIMSEAFWDIDKVPGIEFDKEYYPLTNYNAILKESYSGYIITSVFGGGTADTEFSFLTGNSLSITKDIKNPYSLYIHRDILSLPWILKNTGYKTTSFHPGDKWVYNRYNVYDYLGFNRRFFVNDMKDISRNNFSPYVLDKDTFNFLLADFENHRESNPSFPYFNFTVTIQNHGPYPVVNIGHPKALKKNNKLSGTDYNMINNYAGGLEKTDKALGHLVDELREVDEPVVLLFFSDHLPFLGNNFAAYQAMDYEVGTSGSTESYINTYKVPYFIWSNEAAKDLLEEQGKPAPVGKAPTISSNYLSTELLKYIGINTPAYINYLNQIKKSLPIITSRVYRTGNGKLTETLTDKEQKIISDYRILQHYMMFDNKKPQ
ncbi:MAG TPA: LTA synthase family protein [Pseudobacteroides sp.]|uniref:LTA synthase family protein n=1 Tax=Pseudobacteroides sp. TaxID=1968840 RepID=UPI002F95C294